MSRSLIPYLRYGHGLLNLFVCLALLHQGRLGLKIRRERLLGNPPALALIKSHRKSGPIITLAAIVGFLSGAVLVLIDTGDIFVFRNHFIVGACIVILAGSAYATSRRITVHDLFWRNGHILAGGILVCLYLLQVFLGINILY